jgi:hypothetical protein
MAVDLDSLLALPAEERMQVAETLLESAAPSDIGPLLRELVAALERTSRALDLAMARLIAFEERLTRARAEVREAVLLAGDHWPFPVRE